MDKPLNLFIMTKSRLKHFFCISTMLIFMLSLSIPSSAQQNDSPGNKVQLEQGGRCQALTLKGAQCKRKAAAGSSYCWQHKGNNEIKKPEDKKSTSESTSSATKQSSVSSKAIRTGPRGGQYYINKNGNKTYIKRK